MFEDFTTKTKFKVIPNVDFQESEKTMKAKEIAALLNGIGYRQEPSKEITTQAKSEGIVIVFGASDDLMEVRGAFDDELGCFGGKTFYISKDGFISRPDCDCEYAEKWYEQNKKNAKAIKAIFGGKEDDNGNPISWTYETDIPHETFNVMEDGEVYCIGIVFEISSLEV